MIRNAEAVIRQHKPQPHCTRYASGTSAVRFAIAVKQRARYGLSQRRYALAKRHISRITRSETPPRRESAWHEAEVVTTHD